MEEWILHNHKDMRSFAISQHSALMITWFLFAVNICHSQTFAIGDSIRIIFDNKDFGVIRSERDLDCRVALTNVSKRPIKAYGKLVFDRAPNVFSNIDCEVYKKERGKYTRIDHYSTSSVYGYYFDSLYSVYGPEKVDSLIRYFDVPKKEMRRSRQIL